MNDLNLDSIADVFAALAADAGAAAMHVYHGNAHARVKSDQTPVCDADMAAEAVILKGLAAKLPQFPVVSEEAVAAGKAIAESRCFILVDPVDGTREFLEGNGEFTVNLALIVDGVPRVGVVYAPALGKLWIAGSKAWAVALAPEAPLPPKTEWRPIRTRSAPQIGLTALVSRSHGEPQTEAFLSHLPISERRSAGSSLKFCAIAEGEADVYPRFGPTMEWDTAAGDAVLRTAGGVVLMPSGGLFRYGKFADRLKNGPFIAWGDPTAANAVDADSVSCGGAKTA